MFVVERARGSDAKRLAGLAHESLAEAYDESWWNAHLALGDCFIARESVTGDVLGFAVAQRQADCEAELSALAVDRNQRGRGVGGALLRSVQSNLHDAGSFRIHLDVRADDGRARDFYMRHGYAPEGVIDRAYRDGSAALRLSRPI